MTVTRKDATATLLTVLVVLVYAATHEAWNVPLVGSSHRWAAGAVLLLGSFTCTQGTMTKGLTTWVLGTLGVLALVFAVLALVTASVTPLSLLVADIVLLWAVSTARHVSHASGRPIAA